MINYLRKAMLRRYWNLYTENMRLYELSLTFKITTPEWLIAYRNHRKALDRVLAFRKLMKRLGWDDLTWENYYGSPRWNEAELKETKSND